MSTALTTRKTAFEMRHIANWCEAMAVPAVRNELIRRAKEEMKREDVQRALEKIRREEAARKPFETTDTGVKYRDRRNR